jgi:hypothetical protein
MGRSFYLGSDAELYNGTKVFSDLINAAATTYGLTTAQATSYKTLSDDFVAKQDIATAPATRTKTTILDRNNARDLLRPYAAQLAKIIEATPTVTDGQKAALGLSVRATPAPKPPPGAASNFKVALLADGSIEVTWKASNPPGLSGTMWQVWRRFGAADDFAYVCAAGVRKFIDSSIPSGTSQVTYQIQGVRSTGAGPWTQFNVTFGQTGAGATLPSVVETKVTPRKAA